MGSVPCANEPPALDNMSQYDISFSTVFQNTGGTCRDGIRAPSAEQPHAGGNAMNSKIALRFATLAIGTAAFAAVPALAQDQNPQMESKRQAAAQRNNLHGVEKWDHGKKYYDYTGTMPPAPTQQEMESKRQAAAQRNNLHGVEKWAYGKKYYDYTGTMPPAPTQQEMKSKQEAAVQRRHLRAKRDGRHIS